MASTILILLLGVVALSAAWSLLIRRSPITEAHDQEQNELVIDVQVFRALVDRNQELFLFSSLPSDHFRMLQKRRIALALRMLGAVEKNADRIMQLVERARSETSVAAAGKENGLSAIASQLRLKLFLAKVCLYVKWLFPAWTVFMPAFGTRSELVLETLVRIEPWG